MSVIQKQEHYWRKSNPTLVCHQGSAAAQQIEARFTSHPTSLFNLCLSSLE
jgi:hypothetical protein